MTSPTVAELAGSELLAVLSPEELNSVAPLFAIRRFPKGAILISEGDHLDVFSIVLSGRVKFFWRDDTGRQVDAAIVGPGEDFAAQSVGGEPMLDSVIALDDVRLASLPVSEFERLLLRHPPLAVAYLKRVVALFRGAVAGRKSFSMDDVYGRIVRLLLASAVETEGALTITERLTHAAIGQRVGATREMVGRVLRDLARGGYVKVEKGRISILRKPPRNW